MSDALKNIQKLGELRDVAANKAAPEITASSITFGRIIRDTFDVGFNLGFEAGMKAAQEVIERRQAELEARAKRSVQ